MQNVKEKAVQRKKRAEDLLILRMSLNSLGQPLTSWKNAINIDLMENSEFFH